MNKEFKASHFDNIEELLKHCDMWIKDEDYDAYCRWFDMGAMEEMVNHITNLKQALNKIRKISEKEVDKGTFDTNDDVEFANIVVKEKFSKVLQIIDKVLGDDLDE